MESFVCKAQLILVSSCFIMFLKFLSLNEQAVQIMAEEGILSRQTKQILCTRAKKKKKQVIF